MTGEPQLPAWPEDTLLVIPVFNHAAQIGAVITAGRVLGAPVLVVDDGSTDGSGTIAEEAGAEVIRFDQNQGKAQALRRGMRAAIERGYDRMLSCDADGQHPPQAVAAVAAAIDPLQREIIIGCRRMGEAPFISRLGRFLSNSGCLLISGRWPSDSQSGLRVYPLPICHQLPAPARRYAFEIEILIRAAWAGVGVRAIDVDVLYPSDRVTHFNKLRDNLQATTVLARLALRRCWPTRQRLAPAAVPEEQARGQGGPPPTTQGWSS